MRNHGIAFGYSIVGYKSLVRGLNKLDVNSAKIEEDLNLVRNTYIKIYI